MEPEFSLKCSQGSATGPYPDSDESSPCNVNLTKERGNLN
jgi:hypothetical protein